MNFKYCKSSCKQKDKRSDKYSLNNTDKKINIFKKNALHMKHIKNENEPSDENLLSSIEDKIEETNEANANLKSKSQEYGFKNSIQIIYEINKIQPIKFCLVETTGPPHKPTFKYKLTINFNQELKDFIGSHNSVKNARKLTSIKCLHFLINNHKIQSDIGNLNCEFIRKVIETDFKSLNIDLSLDEYFLNDNDINNQNSSINNSTVSLHIDEELDEEIVNHSHPTTSLKRKISDESIESCSHQKKIKQDINPAYSPKTQVVIASGNALSILNHMLQTIDYSFNELPNNNGCINVFRMELRIVKNIKLETKLQSYKQKLANLQAKNSLLIFDESEEYKFIGVGTSKKLARIRSAQLALENIFDIKVISEDKDSIMNKSDQCIDNTSNSNEINIKEFADNVSELVKEKYYSLLDELNKTVKSKKAYDEHDQIVIEEDLLLISQNKLRSVYAGIIQTNDLDIKSSKIICITTGTKCIDGEFMSMNGDSLNDCHAEILAVRLLRKYLYKQLDNIITNTESSIFETSNTESSFTQDNYKPYQLKKNIRFSLFISSAPCGDGRIFSIANNSKESDLHADNHPNRKVRGLLRAKLESGEGTVPSSNLSTFQTWDGVMIGERLKVMSCSDKLCKYNITGVQGALLSHFIQTIYFDNIIIGGHYNKHHLTRALYGRVMNKLKETDLPNGFQIKKPNLSSITNNLIRQVSKSSNKAFIWSNELNNETEIILCKTGQTVQGIKSFVCKSEMFKSWLNTLNLLKKNKKFNEKEFQKVHKNFSNDETNLTYHEVKHMAKDYQQTKIKIYQAFKDSNLGTWITIPFEQNCFSI